MDSDFRTTPGVAFEDQRIPGSRERPPAAIQRNDPDGGAPGRGHFPGAASSGEVRWQEPARPDAAAEPRRAHARDLEGVRIFRCGHRPDTDHEGSGRLQRFEEGQFVKGSTSVYVDYLSGGVGKIVLNNPP